jgi:hypothetical protein
MIFADERIMRRPLSLWSEFRSIAASLRTGESNVILARTALSEPHFGGRRISYAPDQADDPQGIRVAPGGFSDP